MVPCSRRRLLRGGAVVGGLSVAGCFGMGGYDCETGRSKHNRDASLSEAATWPTFRHDAKNTGYNPDASVPDEVSVRWRYTACAEVDSGAAIAGGRVYPGGAILRGHDGTAITGEWSGYFRTPTIADGTIYGAANELTASATADGSERWTFDPDGESGGLSAPTVANGAVYVSGNIDVPVLYAVDSADGTERWRVQSQHGFDWAPAVAGEVVYAVDEAGRVYAVDAMSGERRWRWNKGDHWRGPAVVSNGTVYVTSYDGGVLALDAVDGTERWRHGMTDTTGPVAVADGTVFAAGDPVVALSAADGSVIWETELAGDRSGAAPTVAGNTVLVGEWALARSDGSERWRFRTRKVEFGDYSRFGVAVGPVLVDDLVFLATKASDLYTLGEATAGGSATETTAG